MHSVRREWHDMPKKPLACVYKLNIHLYICCYIAKLYLVDVEDATGRVKSNGISASY